MGALALVKSILGWPTPAPLPSAGNVTVLRTSPDRPDTMAGESVSPHSALSLSTVWACTNLIAGTIGSLPFTVYRQNGERRESMPEHPLWRLLRDTPNYDQTAVDFWEFLSSSVELWGNGYASIERGTDGRIIALRPIAPHLVVVKRLASGPIEYRWTDEGRDYVRTDAAMLHVRGFGGAPLGGMSTLHFARQSFASGQAMERAAGAMFQNGLRPSGALTFKDWIPPDKRAGVEAALTAKYVGAVNAGRPMVLEGGTTWTPLAMNPEDAQMLESRAFSVEEICRFFGVPPHMVGHTEKSTSWGTGIEQQTIGFTKFTLRRRLKRIEQAVAKQLLAPADRARGVSVEFNLEGLLRGDSAGRAAFYSTMTGIGAMTINEVRRLENLPPVEGGDVARLQMQNVPITQAQEMPE